MRNIFVNLFLLTTTVHALRLTVKTDDKPDSSWYDTMKPIDASSPAPANRLLTRKNVCLSLRSPNADFVNGMEEPAGLERVWTMKDIPSDYSGRIVKGTMLLATVHHFNQYFWANIGHWSSSAFAIFDALDALKDHNQGNLPINVTTVFMKQANDVKDGDWHQRIAQLIGNSNGLKTEFLQGKDLEHGTICAEQVVLYDRPHRKERHYFTDPQHAIHFQEHAIKELGLPDELRASVRKPGRILNMINRKDAQGWYNWKNANEEIKAYLKTRCWEMVEYDQKKEPLRNQAAMWARGDLSVSVHGAHFSNLVFQGQKTGAIIVEKPGVVDVDNCELGQEMGILTYKAGPQGQTKCMKDLLAERREGKNFARIIEGEQDTLGALGTYEMGSSPAENAPFNLRFEKDFKPVLEQAINDLEAMTYRGPPCKAS